MVSIGGKEDKKTKDGPRNCRKEHSPTVFLWDLYSIEL
jgi:hypothetical protein